MCMTPNPSESTLSLCPSCLKPNKRFAAFCESCGSPIGTTATLDPIQTIHTQGHLFRKALDGPPKPVVLIGMWIMFLPMLVGSIYAAVRLIQSGGGMANFVFFWAFVGLAYISVVILYRITRNYLRKYPM